MSDGPHRSLNMRRGWKQLAERADKKAFAPQEICDAIPMALEQDWRAEVPRRLLRQVRATLEDDQSSFFEDQRPKTLEVLRGNTAGSSLATMFLDCAIQEAAGGKAGDQVTRDAVRGALMDRTARGIRQVEEHYYRESTQNRAMNVRERLESGVAQTNIPAIVDRVTGTDKSASPRMPVKQTGLDDGVQL